MMAYDDGYVVADAILLYCTPDSAFLESTKSPKKTWVPFSLMYYTEEKRLKDIHPTEAGVKVRVIMFEWKAIEAELKYV